MIKQDYRNKTVGEIVSDDFRAAEIFINAGIDFCCGGNQTLEGACMAKKLEIKLFEQKLSDLDNIPKSQTQNFKEWNLDFLCDYIQNTHHKVVEKLLPQLRAYTEKIANVHGGNHSELIDIADIFSKLNSELSVHLKKEEDVLFPAIKDFLNTKSENSKQIIISEITRMKGEHEAAGGGMDRINELSNNYKLPVDACNTYSVAYKLLREFEDDLHIHVHLENNILFPKALKL